MIKTIDHVYPVSKGGYNRNINKVFACQFCNSFKSNLLPQELIYKATHAIIRQKRFKGLTLDHIEQLRQKALELLSIFPQNAHLLFDDKKIIVPPVIIKDLIKLNPSKKEIRESEARVFKARVHTLDFDAEIQCNFHEDYVYANSLQKIE